QRKHRRVRDRSRLRHGRDDRRNGTAENDGNNPGAHEALIGPIAPDVKLKRVRTIRRPLSQSTSNAPPNKPHVTRIVCPRGRSQRWRRGANPRKIRPTSTMHALTEVMTAAGNLPAPRACASDLPSFTSGDISRTSAHPAILCPERTVGLDG